MKKTLFAIISLIAVSNACLAESKTQKAEPNHISVKELLAKFAEAQKRCESYIIRSETILQGESRHNLIPSIKRGTTYKQKYLNEIRSDGQKSYFFEKTWGEFPDGQVIENEPDEYNCWLWDGKSRYEYQRSNKQAGNDVLFLAQEGTKNANGDWILYYDKGKYTRGFFDGSTERIDNDLKNAQNISVQQKIEVINGAKCYVITATSGNSMCNLWIDFEHGYNIAKALVQRSNGVVGKTNTKSIDTYLRNVRFQKIGDEWVPVEAEYGYKITFNEGGYTKGDCKYKVHEYKLNPDHQKEKSFDTDFIRNGARVSLVGVRSIRYIWQDGKVIDQDGKVIIDCLKTEKKSTKHTDEKK